MLVSSYFLPIFVTNHWSSTCCFQYFWGEFEGFFVFWQITVFYYITVTCMQVNISIGVDASWFQPSLAIHTSPIFYTHNFWLLKWLWFLDCFDDVDHWGILMWSVVWNICWRIHCIPEAVYALAHTWLIRTFLLLGFTHTHLKWLQYISLPSMTCFWHNLISLKICLMKCYHYYCICSVLRVTTLVGICRTGKTSPHFLQLKNDLFQRLHKVPCRCERGRERGGERGRERGQNNYITNLKPPSFFLNFNKKTRPRTRPV